jgi:hypothetical protein
MFGSPPIWLWITTYQPHVTPPPSSNGANGTTAQTACKLDNLFQNQLFTGTTPKPPRHFPAKKSTLELYKKPDGRTFKGLLGY